MLLGFHATLLPITSWVDRLDMKLSALTLGLLISLSTAASANNWMKLLEQSDKARLRAEQPTVPVLPLQAPISSPFGQRHHPITGEHKLHKGIDLAAAEGTPFHAVLDGTVVQASTRLGYGKTILIEHDGGIHSLYAHASEILVTEGDRVLKNQIIGEVGLTGFVTGPHLHLEMHVDGKPVDPHTLLTPSHTLYPQQLAVKHQVSSKPATTLEVPAQQPQSKSVKKGGLFDSAIKTHRSLWSLANQISSDLAYPSIERVMDVLVEKNPRAFPTQNRDFRLAGIPLQIPSKAEFEASLPQLTLSRDPIWTIAKRYQSTITEPVSIFQVMVAIKTNNPTAFPTDNLNFRLASEPLLMPSVDQILAVSKQEALDFFRTDTLTFDIYARR